MKFLSSRFADRLFVWSAKGAALLTLSLLVGILLSLIAGAWPALSQYGFKGGREGVKGWLYEAAVGLAGK